MAIHRLPERARQVVRALIEVVKPRKPGFDPPVEGFMLDFMDNFYSYFPFHLRILFPMGIFLMEHGAILFAGTFTRFTKMDRDAKEKYIQGWINSKMVLRRELIKGVKGVCLTAFYSHPDVMKHIEYDLPAHIAAVNKGEPADKEAAEYFRKVGWQRTTLIPYPGYDRVELVCRDIPAEGRSGEGQ